MTKDGRRHECALCTLQQQQQQQQHGCYYTLHVVRAPQRNHPVMRPRAPARHWWRIYLQSSPHRHRHQHNSRPTCSCHSLTPISMRRRPWAAHNAPTTEWRHNGSVTNWCATQCHRTNHWVAKYWRSFSEPTVSRYTVFQHLVQQTLIQCGNTVNVWQRSDTPQLFRRVKRTKRKISYILSLCWASTSVHNMTLPAAAAERTGISYRSIFAADDRVHQQSAVTAAIDRTDGRTDTRPLNRPCSTYYANTTNWSSTFYAITTAPSICNSKM